MSRDDVKKYIDVEHDDHRPVRRVSRLLALKIMREAGMSVDESDRQCLLAAALGSQVLVGEEWIEVVGGT